MAPLDASDTADWLNVIVSSLWPNVTRQINEYLSKEALPDINAGLRTHNLDRFVTLQVLDLALGSEPPRLGRVTVNGVPGEHFELVVDAKFCSSVSISMYAMGSVVGIKSLAFRGDLVIRSGALVDELPCVDNLLVFFRVAPGLDLQFEEYVNLPGLEAIIRSTVGLAINRCLVAPNALCIPITDESAPYCTVVPQPEQRPVGVNERGFGMALSNMSPPAKPHVQQSCDWLNDALMLLWPRMAEALENSCIEALQATVDESLGTTIVGAFGTVGVAKFSFGAAPPVLGRIRLTHLGHRGRADGIEVSCSITFKSDIEIGLRALSADVGVRCSACKGELVIRMPTSGRGLLIYFREVPAMNMSFSGLANLTDIPAIGRALQTAVSATLAARLAMPNGVAVSLDDIMWEYDEVAMKCLTASTPLVKQSSSQKMRMKV